MTRLNFKTCVSILILALLALTGCAEETTPPPSAPLPEAKEVKAVPQAAPEEASFFMTSPFDPTGNQPLEIQATETAFMSIAMIDRDVPIENWQTLGWITGNLLGGSDAVPHDCALHARQGIARQLYAACQGPLKISVPHEGGDFVYIVFTDTNNRVARVFQTGSLYKPDTTGLVP